ncbi:MAG: hypothetical protein WC505_01000 [Patescibacteria group bacterium]
MTQLGHLLHDAPGGNFAVSLGHTIIDFVPSGDARAALETVYNRAVFSTSPQRQETEMPNKGGKGKTEVSTGTPGTQARNGEDFVQKGRTLVLSLGDPASGTISGWIALLATTEQQNFVYAVIGEFYNASALQQIHAIWKDRENPDPLLIFGLELNPGIAAGIRIAGDDDQIAEPQTVGEKRAAVMGWLASGVPGVYKHLADVLAKSVASDSPADRQRFDEYMATFYPLGPSRTILQFSLLNDLGIEELAKVCGVRANMFTKVTQFLKKFFAKVRKRTRGSFDSDTLRRYAAALNEENRRLGMPEVQPSTRPPKVITLGYDGQK